MKKNRIYLLMLSLLVLMPFSVNALVFEVGDSVHVIEERKSECFNNAQIDAYISDGNYLIYDNSSGDEKVLTKDGICRNINDKDEYDLYIQKYYSYSFGLDENNHYVIKAGIDRYEQAFYPVENIEVGKKYYTFDEVNVEMNEVTISSENDIDPNVTYYQIGYFTFPDTFEKKDIDYYERYGSYILDGDKLILKNSEYNEENPSSFYILNNDVFSKETVVELNQETFEIILGNSNINDVIYINGVFILTGEDIVTGESVAYDVDGNLIARNYMSLFPLFEELYLIKYDNRGVGIYNKSGELLQAVDNKEAVIEDYKMIVEFYYEDYNGYMAGMTDDENDEKIDLLIHRIYELISGENQKFTEEDLEFTFSGDYDLFDKVLVDDKVLEYTNYTKKEGSTVIKLNKDYLSTLSKGSHTLRVEYSDGGYVNTNFEVDIVALNNPDTGDNIGLTIFIGSLALLSIVGVIIYIKKSKVRAN